MAMNGVNFPSQSQNFIPSLPELDNRKLGGMGKIIRWIRNARNGGLIYRVTVLTLAILTSMALLVSVVLSPIFVWGFREFIIQDQQEFFDLWKRNIRQSAIEQSNGHLHLGRTGPLKNSKFSIRDATRKRMIHDLEIDETAASTTSDCELVQRVSLMFDNYIEKYNLMICSRSYLSEYRLFNIWPFKFLVT